MENNRFPLRKGVACPLKWSWNTIRLAEATTACCHRVFPVPLTVENFDNFHNDPVWISHRKMQLEGKFPQPSCQDYCGHIEAQGGISDRLHHMNTDDLFPPELETDPEAVQVTPRVLEIFINNACNLACIYCDESNSSRIMKENQKFGYAVPGESPNLKPIIPIIPTNTEYQALVDKFFQYMSKNYHHLRKLNALGGEPFYQKEFTTLVDFIVNNENPDLTFSVVSNLMVSRDVLESFIDKMKYTLTKRKLKRVDITASLEGIGPEQEFVRHGVDINTWKSNFEYLASHKWLYLTVNSTITSLTIKTLPDLLEYLNKLRTTRKIHQSFGFVDGRPHLHPKIFGLNYFQQDFEKVLQVMPAITERDLINKQYMEGLMKSSNASIVNTELQKNLNCYLDELDRRRGTDWKDIFPWLASELSNVV